MSSIRLTIDPWDGTEENWQSFRDSIEAFSIGMGLDDYTTKSIAGVEIPMAEQPQATTLQKAYGVIAGAMREPLAKSHVSTQEKTWIAVVKQIYGLYDDQSRATRAQHVVKLLRDGQRPGETIQEFFARKRTTCARDLRNKISLDELLREAVAGGLREEFYATASLHGNSTMPELEQGLKEQERQLKRTKNGESDEAKLFNAQGSAPPAAEQEAATKKKKEEQEHQVLANSISQRALALLTRQMSKNGGGWSSGKNGGGWSQQKGGGGWSQQKGGERWSNQKNGGGWSQFKPVIKPQWGNKGGQNGGKHNGGKKGGDQGGKSEIVCHTCGGRGHRKNQCPSTQTN